MLIGIGISSFQINDYNKHNNNAHNTEENNSCNHTSIVR